MGEQRIALKHGGDGALFGRQIGDVLAIEQNPSGIGSQETSDQVQHGSLAAAGGAQQGDEFTLLHFQIELTDSVFLIIHFAQLMQFQKHLSHPLSIFDGKNNDVYQGNDSDHHDSLN
ncbi:hypothetical protein DSECCO2_316170 [anaerobic digester metagenome]